MVSYMILGLRGSGIEDEYKELRDVAVKLYGEHIFLIDMNPESETDGEDLLLRVEKGVRR